MSQHYLADTQPEAKHVVNRAGRPGAVLVSPTCVRLMNPTTIESATNVPEEFYEQRHSWFVGKFSVTSFVGMRTPNPPITTPIRFSKVIIFITPAVINCHPPLLNFKNRYGITLAADVYLPKDRGNKKMRPTT
ncbi:hypothetical protein JDZ43_11925 [Klebsiella quasipneumoniae]|nr:hypothetical protein JDZ43_11925 [Klebsiella quasipneumoniae]